jgi:lipid-binding SYLF domain-containing protein
MQKLLALLGVLVLAVPPLQAQKKEQERLQECGTVLKEILAIPDDIPQDLLDKAECAIVFPSVLKVVVGIGGNYGRGAIVCRSGKDFTGPWGAPAMFALGGAASDSSWAARLRTMCSWS